MTSPTVRVGVYLPQAIGGDDIALARLAEQRGLDAIWLGDPFRSPDGLEATAIAGVLLQATERIGVGVNVFNLSMRQPQLLARTAATFEAMFPGRFILGLGAGYPDFAPTQEAWGYRSWTPEARLAYFREAIEYLDRYFRNEYVTFEGEHLRVTNARGAPFAGTRPAILVGSGRRSFMRLAARYADLWDGMAMWNIQPGHAEDERAVLDQRVSDFRRICGEEGRAPASVAICQTLYLAVAETREEANAIVDEALTAFVMPGRPLAGNPDDIAAYLAESRRRGVNEFQLVLVSKYLAGRGAAFHRRILELVADEVAPAVR